jgi:hypothetical protein
MKTFVATLKSTSPISFGRYYAQDVPKKDKESAVDYEERTWHNRLHVAEDGRVFIPPFAFKNCLDSAAKYLGQQIPGRGKARYSKHFVSGVLVMDPLILPLKKAEVKGEWRHVPADGMPGGPKRVMKCFPVVPKWEGTVQIQVLDDTVNRRSTETMIGSSPVPTGRAALHISPNQLQQMVLRPAGIRAGLGDGIGWHAFRHTYRTLLDETMAPVKVQQELMRHADIGTTFKYGQAISSSKRTANSNVVQMVLKPKEA